MGHLYKKRQRAAGSHSDFSSTYASKKHRYGPNEGTVWLAAYLIKIDDVHSHATERCPAHNEFHITTIIPCTPVGNPAFRPCRMQCLRWKGIHSRLLQPPKACDIGKHPGGSLQNWWVDWDVRLDLTPLSLYQNKVGRVWGPTLWTCSADRTTCVSFSQSIAELVRPDPLRTGQCPTLTTWNHLRWLESGEVVDVTPKEIHSRKENWWTYADRRKRVVEEPQRKNRWRTSNSVLSSTERSGTITCLKATGRPESMDTEAKFPLPMGTSLHSGLISELDIDYRSLKRQSGLCAHLILSRQLCDKIN